MCVSVPYCASSDIASPVLIVRNGIPVLYIATYHVAPTASAAAEGQITVSASAPAFATTLRLAAPSSIPTNAPGGSNSGGMIKPEILPLFFLCLCACVAL